ncbi:MAG: hypothetical protein UX09_C0069G0008 [Candidatus Uhrbacteria bacterium GW2011_GWE2_45_35]|uniref:Uncharacterized protein n=2 Tax=Candidatus Uhriibacteriota TaxID=1752732 RepID=A0A0G1J8A8_9BACT|nr:MAG: hypothetical protein UW63_C0095G0007 [Candidatus Uhrbacteria bacterium GW2011_GWF2_44_350]KKU05461.1 MAG: hypothetical protein UX09_C0069G0008 [Candidatus Uhrbacteria bacterium GW2011_GWE2_45_35]HBR81117.1 hypothetical protein [Candidatus Uhrbacteria bacterium]HCU31120.1 hypothetical protein [Candidatus Uhrbacteria bacterium]
MKRLLFLSILLLLVFGFGCSDSTTEDPKTQAEDLDFSTGSTLVLRQTVFGLGGIFAETFSGDGLAEYQITIDSWSSGNAAAFSWSSSSQQETADSLTARELYTATDHPIGDTTSEPEAVYETVTRSGNYSTVALDTSQKIFLPAYWSEGGQVFDDNSLIWLSQKQYQELVETKETTLSLGLFDEKLSSLVAISDKVQNALNTLQQKAEVASQSQDIYKLIAENDWQNFSLKINGEDQIVQSIKASNWFGSYIILANENNPLILKVTLNPFATGSLDLSSPLSAFLGYELTELTIK